MIETQMVLDEAQIAIKAARENTDLVVMSTMVFDKGPRGFFTMWGTPPEDAATGPTRRRSADVVGSNCGNGIDKIDRNRTADAPRRRLALSSSSPTAGLPAYKGGEIHLPRITPNTWPNATSNSHKSPYRCSVDAAEQPPNTSAHSQKR